MNRTFAAVLLGIGFAAGTPAPAADAGNGKRLYDRWCEGCHAPMTPLRMPMAGTYVLEQRYKGTVPAVLTERTDLTPEFIRTIVRNGVNVMPGTRKTEISDAELDDLVAWLTQPKALR